MSETPNTSVTTGWRRLLRIPTPVIFLVCVVVAALLLWWQGSLAELWTVVKTADLMPMLLSIPIYLVSMWLLAMRWHELVRMAQGWSDLPRAAEAFFTSVVINYAAPVGLAVPSRAALTKRALGMDKHSTGVVALWEIGMDVIVLGIGSVIWMIAARGSATAITEELGNNASRYTNFALLGLAILLVILVLFFRKAEQRRKAIHFIRGVIVSPLERPRMAVQAMLLSVAYWVTQGIVLALLVHAMGVGISFELILGLTSLPILIGMLSPIPGGAVVREAMMYVVARIADVPGAEVVAAAVIYRMALFIAIPILYGITRIWLSKRGTGHPNLPQPESIG